MANNLTDAGESLLLTWHLSNGTANRPTAWYASLHTTTTTGPTEAAPQTDEVSTTSSGYARQQIGGSSGFVISGTNPTVAKNTGSALTFGPATSAWGTITHMGIWSTASGSTGSLWTGTLTSSKTVAIGDSVTVAADAIVLSID